MEEDTQTCTCGSEFFIELDAKRFRKTVVSIGTGFKQLDPDGWRVYQCVNNLCRKIYVPEMNTLSGAKRREEDEHRALMSTVEGKPISLQPAPMKRGIPGYIV